jgi:hypothetical protein
MEHPEDKIEAASPSYDGTDYFTMGSGSLG